MKRSDMILRAQRILRNKSVQFSVAILFGLGVVVYVYVGYTANVLDDIATIEQANDPGKIGSVRKRIARLKKEKATQAEELERLKVQHKELTRYAADSDAEAIREIIAACSRSGVNLLHFSELKGSRVKIQVAGSYIDILAMMEKMGKLPFDLALESYSVKLGNGMPVAEFLLHVRLLRGAL
jgi:Tfp pilus assembly protein PilO